MDGRRLTDPQALNIIDDLVRSAREAPVLPVTKSSRRTSYNCFVSVALRSNRRHRQLQPAIARWTSGNEYHFSRGLSSLESGLRLTRL